MPSTPEPLLRPATPDDAAALATLHALCFDRGWTARELTDFIETPGIIVPIAVLPGGIAGFVVLRPAIDEAEVLTLAVDPVERGRGLGRRLVETALADGRAGGVRRVFLEVAAGNEAARRLYRSAGFARVGRRAGYYATADGRRDDALVLAREV